MMFQYYIKIVPTTYQKMNGKMTVTNQFSSTKNAKVVNGIDGRNVPGVFFFFDLLPMKVNFKEERRSFLTFLTSVCAIVGGVFTVSGILDALLYHGQRAIRKKVELGKFS